MKFLQNNLHRIKVCLKVNVLNFPLSNRAESLKKIQELDNFTYLLMTFYKL